MDKLPINKMDKLDKFMLRSICFIASLIVTAAIAVVLMLFNINLLCAAGPGAALGFISQYYIYPRCVRYFFE